MSKILKNNTGSDVDILDTGVTITASGQYTIPPNDYLLWAASSDAVTKIGDSTLTVNDGSNDLSISDGVDLIKGLYPKQLAGPNGNAIDQENPLQIGFRDTAYDAFARIRMSEPNTIFDYSFTQDTDFDLYWDTSVVSGATVSQGTNNSSLSMTITNTIGSKVIVQSRRHMEYFTGKSHIAYFTGNPGDTQAGVRKRLGLFNEDNGYFFELDGDVPYVCVRSKTTGTVVDNRIAITNWNGDVLQGLGPSGIDLDLSKQQLFWIDIAWLGSGQIRFGVTVENKHILVHTYYGANYTDGPFTQTAVLPLRVEMECTGVAAAGDTVDLTCIAYLYEGKSVEIGKLRNNDTGTSQITISTTETAIYGLRINPNNLSSAIELIRAKLLLVSGNSEVRWRLLYNPVLSGSPTWSAEANSIAQTLDSPTTVSYTNGFVASSGYINIGEEQIADFTTTDLRLGHDLSDVPDIFLLVVRTISSNSKIFASIERKEHY